MTRALSEGVILLDVEARDLAEILGRALDELVARGLVAADDRDRVLDALHEREERVSTAIGHAVAVPHAYLDSIAQQVFVFVRLAHPLNLGAPDGIPTRFLFILLGPPGSAGEHLDTLTGIARLMSDDEFRYDAGEAANRQDLLAAVAAFNARLAPPAIPTAAAIPAGLRYTGRLCGGILGDLRRRLPHYSSDLREALHPKCLASVLFLYFACLAPTLTFGGLMAEMTGYRIGVVEALVSSAACGMIFGLFGGQTLIILGATGPLLIFTAMLFDLCVLVWGAELGARHFLPAYAWVGVWTAGFVLLLAVGDASCLMRYFTRFTDEIFAALISLIYVASAISALVAIVRSVYSRPATSHDNALVPLLLAFGTFYVAMTLSRFRRSPYLLPKIREFLADFGPTIALASMTLVAVWLHQRVRLDLKELPAPDSFRPTHPADSEHARPWLINLFDAPQWVWLAAAGPAVLGAVLVYVDQNITARLVNSPDHKLRKGEAYHWDLAIVGLLVGVCSLFGLPWCVAATVRSLNHVRSLATVEEIVSSHGENREKIIHVRENRVTGFAIHALFLGSVLLLPVLKSIPMAALYGLFLYMGVVSMAGNQFLRRLALWFTDPARYPTTHYLRRVPLRTIHHFTLLQLACLAALASIQVSPLGILFPLLVVLLVPVRLLSGRLFKPEHVAALDAAEEPQEEDVAWA
ncbi:MAG TPA: PTS sugar transporter subunit IIA [Planctomycetaceae bacterium]|nr:PTS sugar transporter subunit IIA [Planctomycetaceae bacterium]